MAAAVALPVGASLKVTMIEGGGGGDVRRNGLYFVTRCLMQQVFAPCTVKRNTAEVVGSSYSQRSRSEND